jgi:hypothetical protein
MFGSRETLAAACHIVDPDDIFLYGDLPLPALHFSFAQLHAYSLVGSKTAMIVIIDQAAHVGDSDLARRAPAIVTGVIGLKRLPAEQTEAFLSLVCRFLELVSFDSGLVRNHNTRRRSCETIRMALTTWTALAHRRTSSIHVVFIAVKYVGLIPTAQDR